MAVFRPRPLRPQEAGQQTDRKYAAAAMRALVSLQMQGMPRAFEAFLPFFIWRSGARTFFQKNGDPFSHLFLCFFEHRSYIKSLPKASGVLCHCFSSDAPGVRARNASICPSFSAGFMVQVM